MRRKGFTLIEMLVVVAIILALLGILVAAIGPAMQTASTVATQNFLTSMSAATVAFERDHGFYPQSKYTAGDLNGWSGAEIICQALTGFLPATDSPNDGVLGMGAKKLNSSGSYATSGRTYGPYLEIKHERTLAESKNGTASYTPNKRFYLTIASSANAAPILYFRKQTPSVANPKMWNTANPSDPETRYRISDNYDSSKFKTGETNRAFQYWEAANQSNGGADEKTRRSFEASARSAEYLLVAAGPDDQFGISGTNDTVGDSNDIEYDDVIVTGP